MNTYKYTILLASTLAITLWGCTTTKVVKKDTPQGVVKTIDEVSFKIGDLTVLHKQTPANQVISVQMYMLGGTQRLDKKTAGIEQFAVSVSTSGGTKTTSKDTFNAKLDSVGASIGGFSDRDYSGVAFKTITTYFDDVWPLFAQTVLEPAMPEDEIELQRKRQIAAIEGIKENPDALMGHIATQSFFKGHPYQNTQLGTVENVKSFTRDQLVAYQKSLLDPQHMLLVVVGNVSREDLTQKIKKSFGALKSSTHSFAKLPKLTPSTQKLAHATLPLPTNYIFGLFSAPEPGHPDYAAMVVAMDYLSDRFFEEVRTKRNLTYAVSAGLSSRKTNYGYIYVTAAAPEKTLPVMYAEIDKLKEVDLTKQQIKETLNVFLTSYYMDMEANSSQGSNLAAAHILTGDWQSSTRFLSEVQKVTPADIKRVVNTYVKDFSYGVVGTDKSKLPLDMFKR